MQVYTAIPLGAMENSNNSSSDEGFMSRVRSRNTDGKLKVLIGLLLVIVTLVIIVVSTQPHHHSHHHKQHKSLLQYNTPYPYSAHEESRIQKMMQQRENMVVQSHGHGPRYLRSSPVVVVVTKSTPSSPRMMDMMSPSQQLMNSHSMNMSFESLFEHDMNSSMIQMMNVMEQEMMRDFHRMNRVLDSVIGESPSVEDHFMRPCSMRMPHLVEVLNEPKVNVVPVTAAVTTSNEIVEEKEENDDKDLVKAKTDTVDVVPEVEQEDTVTTTTDNTPETVEFPDEDSLPDFNAEFPDEDSLPDFDGAEEHMADRSKRPRGMTQIRLSNKFGCFTMKSNATIVQALTLKTASEKKNKNLAPFGDKTLPVLKKNNLDRT